MTSAMRIQSGDLWWKNAVLYCLDVETYMDDDGDGVGDFGGLMNRLDHLVDLGVSCLWLLPFYPSPGRDDGYDVSDFYSVDPRLGTLGDFVAFLHGADERGIRVIIDLVVNHTSDEHPWFLESRSSRHSAKRDWYLWRDEPIAEADGEVFPGEQQGNWAYDEATGQYYFHRFHPFQPDLNIANPEVREEILQIMRFWLQLGVSGFRLDAVPFVAESVGVHGEVGERHHEWLKEMADFARRRRGDAVLVGEANIDPREMATYFGESDEMRLLFNYSQNAALIASLATADAEPVREHFRALPAVPPVSGWLNFARLHDEVNLEQLDEQRRQAVFDAFGPDEDMRIYGRGLRRRLPPMLGRDRRRLELAYSLTFATPGMPMLLYGEEVGMGDNLVLPGRLAARTPMQWTPAENGGFSSAGADQLVRPVAAEPFGPKHANVLDQQHDPGSFLHWMHRLIVARKQSAAIGHGGVEVVDTGHRDLLAHRFTWLNQIVVVVHNLSDRARPVALRPLAGDSVHDLTVVFADDSKEAGGGLEDGEVELPGYGYRWLRGFTEPTTNPLP